MEKHIMQKVKMGRCLAMLGISVVIYVFCVWIVNRNWADYMRFGEPGINEASQLARQVISDNFRRNVVKQYRIFGVIAIAMYVMLWLFSSFKLSEIEMGRLGRHLGIDMVITLLSFAVSFYNDTFLIPGTAQAIAIAGLFIQFICLVQLGYLMWQFTVGYRSDEAGADLSDTSNKLWRLCGILLLFLINGKPVFDFFSCLLGLTDNIPTLTAILGTTIAQASGADHYIIRTYYDVCVAIGAPLLLLILLSTNILLNAPMKMGVCYGRKSPVSHLKTLVTLKIEEKNEDE